ncbi:unnamed protein product [Notodromas monacha]|uniref:Elongator complex protein 1 n=1 Tax=Notodromas monacha TaxID=399045 RepID=A0A7R9BHB4_9CRUS|nr:unnamed protein product [Notodromas monacha]CAG0914805.1 unnamed protein product [Notodromas monacha]
MRDLKCVGHHVSRLPDSRDTIGSFSECVALQPPQCEIPGLEAADLVGIALERESDKMCVVSFRGVGDGRVNLEDGLLRLSEELLHKEVASLAWTWDGLAIVSRDGSIAVYADGSWSICRPSDETDDPVVEVSRSSDGEIFILLRSSGVLTLLDSAWYEICAVALEDVMHAIETSVSVGWGDEKTQFKGVGAAKAAREGKVGADVSHSVVDVGKYFISWRGDGEFFAVSHLMSSGSRVLRVFDRQGQLMHSSAPNALGLCLAWQPSGSLLASSLHKADRLCIVFFEKNCMPWSEFVLASTKSHEISVTALEWNSSSDILCVATKSPENEKVQLWSRSNYHWDCKFTIDLSCRDLLNVCWDQRSAFKLHIICRDSYECFLWSTKVTTSRHISAAWIAVVSGNEVRVTPLGKRTIPPPMSHQVMKNSQPVQCVEFSQNPHENCFACVQNSVISIYSSVPRADDIGEFSAVAHYECKSAPNLYLWAFVGEGLMYAIQDGKLVILCAVDEKMCVEEAPWAQHITSIKNTCTFASGACFLDGGGILHVSRSKGNIDNTLKLGGNCVDIAYDDHNNIGFGWDAVGGKLFANDWELIRGVTSFRIHDSNFLLVTTGGSDCVLWCISTKKLSQELKAKERRSVEDLGVKRKVENGAKIVVSCPESSAVILQMPRGNIETVYPRELLLSRIASLLQENAWLMAYEMMRRHRINLNVLSDYDAENFLSNISLFVSVLSPEYIAQFVLELTNDDVTKTLYIASYERESTWRSVLKNSGDFTCKVDVVCGELRRVMLAKDPVTLYKPILASFAQCVSPNLEGAICFLASMNREVLQAGLKYLIYLSNVDALFNAALGTYDTQLAAMVAELSQKDPKEYIPFLEAFKKLDSPFREYSIDIHLQRWGHALNHLSSIWDTSADAKALFLKLVKEKALFKHAMKLSPRGSELFREVTLMYGEFLLKMGRREEAALVYATGGHHENAAKAFAASGEEHLAYSEVQKCGIGFVDVGRVLANALATKREFSRAARIAIEWCEDVDTAVQLLMDGRLWSEAIGISQRFSCSFHETIVEKLLDFVNNLIRTFSETGEQLSQRTGRYEVVTKSKFEDAFNTGDGENFPDVISETETSVSEASSLASSRSQRSIARKKKKEERKMRSLREGSRTEDLALVATIHSQIIAVYVTKNDVREALITLTALDRWDLAKELQRAYSIALSVCKNCSLRIWPSWLCAADLEAQELSTLVPGASAAQNVETVSRTIAFRKFTRSRFSFLEPVLRYAPGMTMDIAWYHGILAEGEEDVKHLRSRTELGIF